MISGKATVCPSCGFPLNEVDDSKADNQEINFTKGSIPMQSREVITTKVWKPSIEGLMDATVEQRSTISLSRYVMGIILNVPMGGVG